jgi:2,3-bisphosphoglycerate-dependent phosphoglycerate mutase
MTDLFCPATLIVARHGEATYDVLGIASNDGGWLTDRGRRQAAQLAEQLADRRVAAIWCSDMARSVQTAEIAAAVLGVPVKVRSELREASVGELDGQPDDGTLFGSVFERWLDGELTASAPGAENGEDVVRRVSAELQSAADLFRGETLLVVSHGAAMGVALPQLASNVPGDYARGRTLENCATCELAADADGWVLRTWAGEPVVSAQHKHPVR